MDKFQNWQPQISDHEERHQFQHWYPRHINRPTADRVAPLCLAVSLFQGQGTAQSVQGLATGWAVRGSNPSQGEIFRASPNRSSIPSSPYTMRTGSLPALKGPECSVNHSPPLVPRLKKEYSSTILTLCDFMADYRVNFTSTSLFSYRTYDQTFQCRPSSLTRTIVKLHISHCV